MQVHGPPPTPLRRRILGRGRIRLVVWVLLFAFWTGAVVALAAWLQPGLRTAEWMESEGYLPDLHPHPVQSLTALPGRLLDAAIDDPGAPGILLHIEFTDLEQLREQRARAMERGILIQGDDDYVPATIEFANRSIPARVRLKGDWKDQLENDRWSFRVHVRNDDHVLGMRRFSLHHPAARDFHGEALYLEFMRGNSVLAPRYLFVDVRLNGESLGRMALEEHFSRELLESQGRRESVILKFNEDPLWIAQDGPIARGFDGVFDNFMNAEIEPFQENRVMRDPVLREALEVGRGLLRAFSTGTMSASEVFDVDLMARFVAGSEAWGAWHALRWHNMRFYYNPVTARLEPIAFDASVGHPKWYQKMFNERDAFVKAVLADTTVRRLYLEHLTSLRDEFPSSELSANLVQRQDEYLDQLRTDYLLIQPFIFQRISNRANGLLKIYEGKHEPVTGDWRLQVHAYWARTPDGISVDLASAVPQALEVLAVEWDLEGAEDLVPVAGPALPVRLAATPKGGLPRSVVLDFRSVVPDSAVPLVTLRRADSGSQFVVAARQYTFARTSRPIPETPVVELLERHPFLTLDPDSRTLLVRQGVWDVMSWLTPPPGYGMRIEPGTTLRFGTDAGLVVRGPTRFRGTAEAPVSLEATPGSREVGWPGVLVLNASHKSEWAHVVVRNTSGVGHAGWSLTGGVTFSGSPVTFKSTTFVGNRAEDALNLIHSDFEMSDVTIADASSDGIDADFADGVIRSGRFEQIGERGGGDAIDVSGAHVVIHGATFSRIGDKAVSVGENSRVSAQNLVVESALAGIVAKDGSEVRVEDSTFREIGLAALMAYVKKPEFGPAELTAVAVQFERVNQIAIAQTGSSIALEGESILTSDLDVDELYATVMQRAAAR